MGTSAWIVTLEHTTNAKGVEVQIPRTITGPRIASEDEIRRLKAGEGHAFKIYDDDHVLYYVGRCLEPDSFAPLEDFGESAGGCTGIKYVNPKTGRWEYI